MKHRCAGCRIRKQAWCEVGPRVYYCKDCARAGGILGSRLTNVAEQQSRKWQQEPCKHQAQRNRYIRENGQRYLIGECVRCPTEVWRMKV
jgi:hypothetical protein